jgi:hypothetical protein
VKRPAASVLVAATALLGSAAASSAVAMVRTPSDAGASFRIVDRTFACTPVVLSGGVRSLAVIASPLGAKELKGPSVTTSPGYIGATSGGHGAGSDLVVARAHSGKYFGTDRAAGVYANIGRCSSAKSSVPLSSRGLPGPPVAWAKEAKCEVRGRVLVRVRAASASNAPWQRTSPSYAGVSGRVVEASIAVRSERTRKPLAFMELARTGKTRLWFASSCS